MSTVDFFNLWYASKIYCFSIYDKFETVRLRVEFSLLATVPTFLCSKDVRLPRSCVLFIDFDYYLPIFRECS